MNVEDLEGIMNCKDVYLCSLCLYEDIINNGVSLHKGLHCTLNCKMCWVDYIDGLRIRYCKLGRYKDIR